jgi:hypothetical protein
MCQSGTAHFLVLWFKFLVYTNPSTSVASHAIN